MAFKSGRYHSDYLLWIFPLIILGLIIFTIKRDNNIKESGNSSSTGFNADSMITMREHDRAVEGHKLTYYSDSTKIFYASTKDGY